MTPPSRPGTSTSWAAAPNKEMDIPDSHTHCPVGHATALLGDRWSILILRDALAGTDRYQGFRDALSISDHTLSRRLTHLQHIGLLTRDGEVKARYHLTDAGRDFARVLAVLGDWSLQWLPVDKPMRYPSAAVIEAAEQLNLVIPAHPDAT